MGPQRRRLVSWRHYVGGGAAVVQHVLDEQEGLGSVCTVHWLVTQKGFLLASASLPAQHACFARQPILAVLGVGCVTLCGCLHRRMLCVCCSHHFALALLEGFAIETSFKKWMNLVGKQRPDW